MERIERKFVQAREKGELALVLYVTAGDPSPEHTIEVVVKGAQAGADMFEIGIPFSLTRLLTVQQFRLLLTEPLSEGLKWRRFWRW